MHDAAKRMNKHLLSGFGNFQIVLTVTMNRVWEVRCSSKTAENSINARPAMPDVRSENINDWRWIGMQSVVHIYEDFVVALDDHDAVEAIHKVGNGGVRSETKGFVGSVLSDIFKTQFFEVMCHATVPRIGVQHPRRFGNHL